MKSPRGASPHERLKPYEGPGPYKCLLSAYGPPNQLVVPTFCVLG